ncbi:MAG: hypothetical protein J7M29_08210 [Verrucomicrobia bacterium]|nr:hypothetical protein [Verrucomicrobiota bacterium]
MLTRITIRNFKLFTAFDESDGRGKERMDEFVCLFTGHADALTPSNAPACARLRADRPSRRQVAAAEKRDALGVSLWVGQ